MTAHAHLPANFFPGTPHEKAELKAWDTCPICKRNWGTHTLRCYHAEFKDGRVLRCPNFRRSGRQTYYCSEHGGRAADARKAERERRARPRRAEGLPVHEIGK